MKNVLIALLVIFILMVASAYIFIPKELTVAEVSVMHANENALLRFLSNEGKWKYWWPTKPAENGQNSSFNYNGFTFHLTKVVYQGADVEVTNNSNKAAGKILLLPIPGDSVRVQWQTTFTTSANPLAKFIKYQEAKKLQADMKVILDSLKSFNEKAEGMYAYRIRRTTIKDTTLVATKVVSNHYPTVTDIYNMVADLRKYIASQQAKETNYPMLNVTTDDSVHYTTMVAIPTNKELQNTAKITVKRMLIYKDKTIIAEVKGGPGSIKNAYKELGLYMQDYNLTNPVIHWESLVTDRSKEADTSKWITNIFMPIV